MNLHTLLQLGYSAERAAAFAYQGHAGSVGDAAEKAHIRKIEQEEWEHRANLRRMLERLGLQPSAWYEIKYYLIGRLISLSCHLIGRFLPMYFAGRLESGNVNEYLRMIELARGTIIEDETGCFQVMARVEKEHEAYFLSKCSAHRLMPMFQRIFGWGPDRCLNTMTVDLGSAL